MLGDLKHFRKLSGLAFAAIIVLPLLLQPALAYGANANSLSPMQKITHSVYCTFAGLFNPTACDVADEQVPPSITDELGSPAARISATLPFRAPDTELPERNVQPAPQIIQPVVERTVHTREIVRESGITRDQFDIALNNLRRQIASAQAVLPASYGAPVARSIPNTWGLTQRIDQLSDVDFSGGTITGTPITNSPISGSTGSFTDFFATNATTTNFFATSLTALSGFFTDLVSLNATFTNATTTDFVATGATSLNTLTTSGNTSITGTLGVTGTTTLATTTLSGVLYDAGNSAGAAGELLASTGTSTVWGTIGGSSITADSLDWSEFTDAMTLDANTSIDMDTNGADLNFDSDTLVIDSSTNRVGIGTTAPGAKMEVGDSSSGNYIRSIPSNAEHAYIEIDSSNGIRNSGINFKNSGDNNTWALGRSHGGQFAINYDASAGSGTLLDNSEFVIDTSGNVGIGTTGPSSKLHIVEVGAQQSVAHFVAGNNGTEELLRLERTGSAADSTNEIRFYDNSEYAAQVNSVREGSGTEWGLGFWTGSGTSSSGPSEKVRIQSNGNVGIGTMAPASLLYLHQSDTNVSSSSGVTIRQASSGDSVLQFSTLSTRWAIGQDNSDSDKFRIRNASGNSDLLGADSSGLTIATTGNVGIGTTGPGTPLHVESSENSLLRLESTDNITRVELRDDTDSGYLVMNGAQGFMEMGFSTSIGSGIGVDTSGNVGIGTTAPGEKLDLAGDMKLTGVIKAGDGSASAPAYTNSGDTDGGMWFPAANTVAFSSGGSEAVRIQSDGNVGIGTTGPDSPLEVVGNIKSSGTVPRLLLEDTSVGQESARLLVESDIFRIQDESTTSNLFNINLTTGNAAIGKTTPADKLDVAGDIRVGTGTTGCVKDADGTSIAGTCSSDERLKTSIVDLPDILDNLVELRPVSYHWNETASDLFSYGTSSAQIGLIAQEVEIHLPDLVTEDAEGYRQIRFSDLPIYLLKGMREMWAIVSGNRADIDSLKNEVAALKAQLAASDNFESDADNDNSPAQEPTMQLRGNNPANVALGASYSDLGVIAKDANGSDISVSLLLDGEPVDAISLDTSTSTTHIITYSVESGQGTAMEITRTVIIVEPEETEAENANTAEPDAAEVEEANDESEINNDTSDGGEENPDTQDAGQENTQQPEETDDEPVSTTGENEPGDNAAAES